MINHYSFVGNLAAAEYGVEPYNMQIYPPCNEGDVACQTSFENRLQPGTPNTGLYQQPIFIIPAIIVIAVLLVGIEYAIRRRIKASKLAKSSKG